MDIKKIRNYVVVMLLLVILFPIYGLSIVLIFGEDNKNLLLIMILPYLVYFLYRALYTWNITCPRCKQTFFREGIFFKSLFSCSNCGLNIFKSKIKEDKGR